MFFKEFARYLEERERKKYEHERRKRLQQRLAEERASEEKIAAARAKRDSKGKSRIYTRQFCRQTQNLKISKQNLSKNQAKICKQPTDFSKSGEVIALSRDFD